MTEKKRSSKAKEEKPKKTKKVTSALRLRRIKRNNNDAKTEENNRRFHIFPKFLRNAWAEIRQVTWPSRKETIRLTFAVLVFSIIFGAFVAALDLGLDKLFKEVILR